MNKSIIFAVMTLGLLILVSACDTRESGIYKEKFTRNNFREIAEKFSGDKTVPTEDIVMLTNSLKRLSAYKDSIIGKTVGELIKNEERYVRNYSKNQLSATSDVATVRVCSQSKFIGILPDKNPAGQDINNLYFSFSNNLTKSLEAFSGELVFYYRDTPKAQPVLLKSLPFNFTNSLSAGANDTLIFYEAYSENDNLAVLLRTQTAKISGYMNILQVKLK